MSTQVVACHNCKRLLAEWVVTSKLTMNHKGKNYCRFCYSELRFSGELDTATDDSEFLATVVREAMWKDAVPEERKRKSHPNFSRKTGESKFQQIELPKKAKVLESLCPACRVPFKVKLLSNKAVFGRCSKCQAYLSISPTKVALLSVREHMIMSITQRSGQSAELVEQMFGYVVDELAAQLAERSTVELPSLGNFKVYSSSISSHVDTSNLEVAFRPGKKLLERIAQRRSK